ncbi:FadR/GntR family transcriptional regulator [Agrobacterium sp. NPDC058088]|uniref:FadR/GntR family transcriptional regulator n=1 Tax=Agrobacterium sp. NPDC058088 TaxID=3346335 RepID=UPI0036DBEF48
MTDSGNNEEIQAVLDTIGGGMVITTARQELADRIVAAIAVGAYSPGEQLPSERELAERQGVSRVTVRGAIEIVREKGLLTSRRGRSGGTFVTDIDVDQVAPGTTLRVLQEEVPRLRAFMDFRCLIAGLEARTAAERRTPQQAERLASILVNFCATEDASEARRIDVELHNFITIMAANERLAAVTAQLHARATMGLGAEPYPPQYLERVRLEHTQIVKGIVEQNLERAFEAAYRHFSLTLTIAEDALQKSLSTIR